MTHSHHHHHHVPTAIDTVAPSRLDDRTVVDTVRRVTWVGFAVNAVLAVGKIIVGWLGRSDAMVADGVHSLSDFVTDITVLVMIGISRRAADPDHQYGHGKYETFATLLIAAALMAVGVGMGVQGIITIADCAAGKPLDAPSWIVLWVAIGSIANKEWLFRYTRRAGKRVGSPSLIANAWHHRSDAISSVATLLGVGGALLLGPRWHILDPVATVVIAVFIVFSGWQLVRPAYRELMEASLAPEVERRIGQIISSTPGVTAWHRLRTRASGSNIIADVHVLVNPWITVTAGHDIATAVERRLKAEYGPASLFFIHTEPDNQPHTSDGPDA